MTEDTRTHEELLAEIDDLASQLAEANDEAATLRDENRWLANGKDGAEDRVQKLEDELSDRDSPTEAAHALLDECVRPCGSHKFTIPDNIRVHDAIRAMADAIGRNI